MNIAQREVHLEDVRNALASKSDLKSRTIVNCLDALRLSAEWTNMPLSAIPACVPKICELFDKLDASSPTIGPRKAKLVEKRVVRGIAISGLVPGMYDPLSADWMDADWKLTLAPLGRRKSAVFQFGTYCSRAGIRPENVSDAIHDKFMAHLGAHSSQRNQYKVRRASTKNWNQLVEMDRTGRLSRLTVPASRRKRVYIPETELPPALQADIRHYGSYLCGDSPGHRGFRPDPVSRKTLANVLGRINLALTSALKHGIPKERIQCLSDLCSEEVYLAVLRYRREQTKGEASYTTFYLATSLMQIAKEWCGFSRAEVKRMKEQRDKVPRPEFCITEKNLRIVHRFNNMETLDRFLSCPERIYRDALEIPLQSRNRLAALQASVALHLLMHVPLRIGNLAELVFGESLVLGEGQDSTIFISGIENKSGRPLEYEVPDDLAERLSEYRAYSARFRRPGSQERVFINVNGGFKSREVLAELLKRYFTKYVGFHMNPHAYRHLWAKFILGDRPGAFIEVQRLLGHKNLDVTAKYYSDFEQSRAGKLHMHHVEEALGSSRGNVK